MVEDRAAHGHSNEGRAYLYEETWKAMKSSPLIGYGGPLPVDKSRILPAIGTQGQLWNVMISQGAVGTVLFVGFLLRMTWATRRGPLVTFWAHVVLVVGLVQLPIYDMMPTPLHIVFVVAALGLRELHEPDRKTVPPTASRERPLCPSSCRRRDSVTSTRSRDAVDEPVHRPTPLNGAVGSARSRADRGTEGDLRADEHALMWLLDLVSPVLPDPLGRVRHYGVLPRPEAPRYLIPLDSAKASAAFLVRPGNVRSMTQRALRLLLRPALRLGIVPLFRRRVRRSGRPARARRR